MKKLIMLIVLLGTMISCQQEHEISSLDLEQNENKEKSLKDLGLMLLENEVFYSTYSASVEKLSIKKEQLTQNIDLKNLSHKDGMLIITSVEEFQFIYEQIVKTDDLWQKAYDDEIKYLVKVASNYNEFAEQVEDEDKISFYIQDLFEIDGIGFYDMQKNIANSMPIKTLWTKVRNESNEWLASLGKNPNWEENPDDRYSADTYARLFLNEKNTINIMDKVRTFDTQDVTSKLSRKGAGCRTSRMITEYTDNTGEPTCLRMKCYVNNFWIWKSYGVNAKGWIWSGGRWREWGFNKFLTQGGNIVTHSQSLRDQCDPAFSRNVNWSRTSTAVEFSISRTLWGPSVYLGACRGSFSGVVSGRARAQAAIMN